MPPTSGQNLVHLPSIAFRLDKKVGWANARYKHANFPQVEVRWHSSHNSAEFYESHSNTAESYKWERSKKITNSSHRSILLAMVSIRFSERSWVNRSTVSGCLVSTLITQLIRSISQSAARHDQAVPSGGKLGTVHETACQWPPTQYCITNTAIWCSCIIATTAGKLRQPTADILYSSLPNLWLFELNWHT